MAAGTHLDPAVYLCNCVPVYLCTCVGYSSLPMSLCNLRITISRVNPVLKSS
jgi:hypothetical protein